jgi:hypothetical protein
MRLRARGSAAVIGTSTPKPTVIQEWMATAGRNSALNRALIYFGRGDNWFDIYKTYEALRKNAGGESKIKQKSWYVAPETNKMTHTANALHRHAAGIFGVPAAPMSLDEARQLIANYIRNSFDGNN